MALANVSSQSDTLFVADKIRNTFESAVVGHGQSQVLVSGSNGEGVGNLFKDSRPYAVGSAQGYILLFIIANAYVVYGDDVSI